MDRQVLGAHCPKCGDFAFKPEEAWFDEKGFGYSTKLVKCKTCGRVVVVNHIEDYGFSKLNTDVRWYYK